MTDVHNLTADAGLDVTEQSEFQLRRHHPTTPKDRLPGIFPAAQRSDQQIQGTPKVSTWLTVHSKTYESGRAKRPHRRVAGGEEMSKMVAIVAGTGLGLFDTSLNTVGEAGVLGQSALGQGSSRAIVNAVTGNLVLQAQDEQLAGRGPDLLALRSYNSLGTPNDGDGDGWRWGYEQTVRFQGPGTPAQPQAGAAVIRTDRDGHETAHSWDAARAEYLGQGQHGLRHAYDSNGNKVATVNAVGTVFVDTFDANGNQLTHKVLRLSPGGENGTYVSGSGNVPVAVLLDSHGYDRASSWEKVALKSEVDT